MSFSSIQSHVFRQVTGQYFQWALYLQKQLRMTLVENRQLKRKLAQQQQQLLHDPLSTLANRQAYDQHLPACFARSHRYDAPLTLVIADVDGFKSINDQFGHVCGDKVLQQIAQLLKSTIREVDFIARYGGDEFVMLFEHTDRDQATRVVRKLIDAIHRQQHSGSFSVSISFGLTQLNHEDTPLTLFNRADRALYQAKCWGKDRFAVS